MEYGNALVYITDIHREHAPANRAQDQHPKFPETPETEPTQLPETPEI